MKKIKNIFTDGPISAEFIGNSLSKHQSKTSIGAHAMFMGQVRADQIDGNEVRAINYTAYEAMANEKMAVIREEAFKKFDLVCMHVHHSLGKVQCGEICLFIFTSSKHRIAAQQACSFLVEAVKNELPIWGEELLSNDAQQWKVNH